MDDAELGRRVRMARAYSPWPSQEAFAARIGMGTTTLGKTERGERRPDRWELKAIAYESGLPEALFVVEWETLATTASLDEEANPGPAEDEEADDVASALGELDSAAREAGSRASQPPRQARDAREP